MDRYNEVNSHRKHKGPRQPKKYPSYYLQYINSGEWRAQKIAILAQRGPRCEDCSSTKRIQVHHLTYERLGRELPGDLRVLCNDCHERRHGLSPQSAFTR